MKIPAFLVLTAAVALAQPALEINKTVSPPAWALLERELLKQSSLACDRFANKYLDARGYLLHTPRWGTLDGPDDAIETFYNWTLLHALGGSDSVLANYKRALEGHYLQYKEMRTVKTKLAANGAYHKEFITQSDWFHTGEGIRAFMFLGLSDPTDPVLRLRMKRFAGLYMNEDPEAPNYDPVHKVIKSIWTGSKGPMLHKATSYDWVGDPVPGTFHLLHGKQGRGGMVDLMSVYDKMLAHCDEYLDSVGDHPLNLASTGLALNAYMLTGEKKYKDWVLEYVGAWKQRTDSNGGNIPTNIGLNGQPGGEYGGKWYKGTYGWNFTVYDGEIDQMAHRNTFDAGSWPGFGNAFLLSKGDPGFVATLRKQMENLYAQKKVINGKTMLPNGYGDPRGHKFTGGKEEWYNYTPNLFTNRLMEIYLWSMDPKDRQTFAADPWLSFLEGKDAAYPERALRQELESVRHKVAEIETDDTSADTRLADYLMGFNPAATDALSKLTLGSYLTGNVWTLHARVRYFDPVRRRSGLPDDVAALVEGFTTDTVSVRLVNVSSVAAREVTVQAGAYGEHQILTASVGGKTINVNGPAVKVRLAPGAGDRLELLVKRYSNEPTLRQPWDSQ
ncbi:MAG: hypothetical protein NTX13_16930 [Acidobacteria bacterium]|nr:hypothetical protein [Acidobacteriota bacterium]